MGLVPNNSVSDLQAGSAHVATAEKSTKVKCAGLSDSTALRNVDADLSKTLRSSMKGSIMNKLEGMGEIIYAYSFERLGPIAIESKEEK